MNREKLCYGGAIVLLVAALILGLWYKQPKTIREITGVTAPETVSVTIERRDASQGAEQRELTLSAGDEGFDALMAQLDELEFRRPPTNLLRIALPFLGDFEESSQELDDGDFQHLVISPSQPGEGGERIQGYVNFFVSQWSYRDFKHDLTLPLAVVDGKETGQALCAQLWDMATPAKTNP